MNKIYKVLGIMSGTSADGLDIAYCHLHYDNKKWHYQILEARTYEYELNQKKFFKDLLFAQADDFIQAHYDFGKMIGEYVNLFVKTYHIAEVDFIASHGHTVFHQPKQGFTFQIGHGAAIAATSGYPVVCDFRSSDVCYGGQGAPLVPIGDSLLFEEFEYCLNLGGFVNISYSNKKNVTAFDICPANIVLNYLVEPLNMPYDKNGDLARKGDLIPELFNELNNLEFYSQMPPKSLGKEWVDKNILPLLTNFKDYAVKDLLHTFTEHVALQVSRVFPQKSNSEKVLVTGGGALNTYLIERLVALSKKNIIVPDIVLVKFKESLVFALLGVLRWEGKNNCLASVTGAKKNNVGGCIYLP